MNLNDPEQKRAYVQQMFNRIAGRYDLMNLVMTGGLVRRWQRVFLEYTRLGPGDRALDVCCGTGDLVLLMAGRVAPGGRVFGLDFADLMLDIGRRRAASSPHAARIELVRGDALDLPFPDDTFQAVTSGFALRNVVDLPRALAEMARVAAPGGWVVSLEMSKPVHPLMRGPYSLYFNHIVPILGRLINRGAVQAAGPQAYAYLPGSLVNFPDRYRLAEMFRQAGLADVVVRPLAGGAVAVHAGRKPEGGKS